MQESQKLLAELDATYKRIEKVAKRRRRRDRQSRKGEEANAIMASMAQTSDHVQPNSVGSQPLDHEDVTSAFQQPVDASLSSGVSTEPAFVEDEGLHRNNGPGHDVSRPVGPAIEDQQLCVICLSCAKTHVVVPCMHKCLCSECSRLISTRSGAVCPMCRGSVQLVAKVFE